MKRYRKTKSVISLLLVIILCFCMMPGAYSAAGTISEKESNNTAATADVTYDDYDNTGTISSTSDIDWWKVTFSQNGWANYWLGNISSSSNLNLRLYASDKTTCLEKSEKSGNKQELIRYDVVAGTTYYIRITGKTVVSGGETYKFRAKYYPSWKAKIFTVDCNDLDTRDAATFCLPYLWKMGYDAGEYENNSAVSGYNVLDDTDIVIYHNHGGPGRITFNTSATAVTRIYGTAFSGIGSSNRAISNFASGDLSGLKLVVFGGCETGLPHSTYGDLVNEAIDHGAQAAIGFEQTAYVEVTNAWLKYLFISLESGNTLGTAMEYANNKVELEFPTLYTAATYNYFGESDLTQVLG